MNSDEWRQDADRLLAILQSGDRVIEITEDGQVTPMPVDEEMTSCDHCEGGLTREDMYVVMSECLCHVCAWESMAALLEEAQRKFPEWRDTGLVERRARCACPACKGKVLLFNPASEPKWQTCALCEGRGALTALTLAWRDAGA